MEASPGSIVFANFGSFWNASAESLFERGEDMIKRCRYAVLLVIVLLASGCMNLWKAPDGIASLNLHGLANNPEARSVLWTATREDGNVVSGNERITGDELRIDVNLKAGSWVVEVKLLNESL